MALRFANALFEPVWNRNFIDHVADHRRRGHRHRRPRRLLRGRRRAARPRPEPHDAAAGAADDGAAGIVRGQPAARREAEGARGDRPADARRGDVDGAARAVRTGRGRRATRSPATARRRASPTTRAPRPTPRCGCTCRTGAGPGVPFYLRTGKRLARKVTEIAVTLKPVPHLAFQSSGSVGVQANQIILTVQPDEGVSVSLGAKIPGPADADPPGEHGVPLRHLVHVRVARGVRAADPRRDARRRDAVHPQRRDRGAVGDHRPDPDRMARGHRPRRSRSTRPDRRARRRRTALLDQGRQAGGGCDRGRLGGAEHNPGRDRRRRCARCCTSATPPTRRSPRRAS